MCSRLSYSTFIRICRLIVLCETKQNKTKSALCEIKIILTNPSTLLQSWLWHIIFGSSLGWQVLHSQQPRAFLTWCLENADLEHSWLQTKKNSDPLGVLKTQTRKRRQIFPACLPQIASRHLVYLVYHFAKYCVTVLLYKYSHFTKNRFHFARYRISFWTRESLRQIKTAVDHV